MNNKTKNIDAERTALLPCPFCGGPVNLELVKIDGTAMYGRREWWGVICRNTENLGGTCAIQQIPSASKEAAVARWNRRATPPSPSTAPIAEDERALYESTISKREQNHDAWRVWQARAALSFRPAGEVELPPLPEAVDEIAQADGFDVIGLVEVYTADQLRAYGQECARAEYQHNVACIQHLTHERDKARADCRRALASKPASIDAEEVASVIEGALVEDVLPYHSPEWVARAQALLAKLKS